MKKSIQIQQGDVLLEKIGSIPINAKKQNHLILAEGEHTGHFHQVQESNQADLFELDGILYLDVLGDNVSLTHQEHNLAIIPRGKYQVGIVLEYDYETEEARRVQD